MEKMRSISKVEVERALAPLVGTPMWGSARAVDMEMFVFGDKISAIDRHGRDLLQGEFALHVQCPWRLERAGSIIVGFRDLYEPASGEEPEDAFDWELQGSNRRDVLLERFFLESTVLVERVDAESTGDLTLFLSHEVRLRIFPATSATGFEYWRFLRVAVKDPHLVCTSDGLSFA